MATVTIHREYGKQVVMISAREAAKLAGVTPKQIYKWLHDGRIKGEGGPIRVDKGSLRDYLKKRDGNRDRS